MENKTHFRRCQYCNAVHSSTGHLLYECQSCGKELTPLYYSQLVKIIQEEASGLELLRDSPVMREQPLIGLTAEWDSGPDSN